MRYARLNHELLGKLCSVVHDTAFSVVIKGFKLLDNGRAKSERNKCFLYKRPFQCVKRFLKVKEK